MPPYEPPTLTHHNPIRRLIRILLILAAALAVVGVPALLGTIRLNKPATRDGTLAATCLVITAIAMPGAVAMLLTALLTIPNARKADRVFDSFRQHDCLAEWTYTETEWRRYIQSEERRLRKVGCVTAAFVGVISLAVWLIIAYAANSAWHGRLIGMTIGAAGALAVAGIIVACNRLYIVTRRRRLSACPRAFLGRNAIFCGGDFAYWGSNMLVLRSARLLEGEVPQLEFIVGTGGAAKSVAQVADIVNTLAGHPTGTFRMTWRYTVPVPEGKLAEAQSALRTILEPVAAQATAPTSPSVVKMSLAPAAVLHPHPVPAPIQKPARRPRSGIWWWITGGLLVVGLGMFLVSANLRGHAATATGVIGFLLWCASPITFVAAAVLTIKRFWSRTAR